jgi:ankyrin repeat protein
MIELHGALKDPARLAALLAAGADVEERDAAGRTALMVAAAGGLGDAIDLLLAAGASPAARDLHGRSALHHAALGADDTTAALALLEAGSAIDAPDDPGATPLALAVDRGLAAVQDALVEAGASPARLSAGQALLLAARRGEAERVSALLALGADPDARDLSGATALHWAAAGLPGRVEVVEALLRAGATVDATDGAGVTALMRCRHRPAVTRALLRAGADPNAATPAGRTPLGSATAGGDAEAVRLLLEAGARRP